MKTKLVKIGNSQGIRLPKRLIEQFHLNGELELEAQADHLILRPVQHPRHDWDAQFRAMAEAGDDRLIDGDVLVPTQWDETEWEW